MPDIDPQSGIPQVQDKRPKIAGLLPKNAQARVLAGVALLMVLVMMFSGRKTPPSRPETRAALAVTTTDPNQARIQEYRARIEEQAQQLALEEAQLSQTKQVLGVHPFAPGAVPPAPVLRATDAAERPIYSPAREKSWVELDREKREYQGLYSSNIALTYRGTPRPAENGERAADGGKESSSAATGAHSAARGDAKSAQEGDDDLRQHRLFEGTIFETVLTNRLDSGFSGPVNCMVTTNVYSHDHQTLLVPQGTRVLGEVRKLASFEEQRLAVTFHRMIMPDGYSVSLDQFKGLNQIGETGLRDQVNHHYLQIFGVSLAIGAIAGLAHVNTQAGLDQSAIDAYQQGVTTSFSQSSLHILDHYLNVLPTFTIREGHRIKIYLSQDLMLPAYSDHAASTDE